MTRKFLTSVFFCLVMDSVSGQGNQSVFLEIGANGLGLSANYDARFNKKVNGAGYRLGIGFYPGVNDGIFRTSPILLIPAGINYVTGKGRHHFEGGLGLTYFSGSFSVLGSDKSSGNGVAFVPSAGYRLTAKGKGIQFRTVISPFISGGDFFVWGGLSIGYNW